MQPSPLPSYVSLATEYGLYQSGDPPCEPEVDAKGAVSCDCGGCRRWKATTFPSSRNNILFNKNFIFSYRFFVQDYLRGAEDGVPKYEVSL